MRVEEESRKVYVKPLVWLALNVDQKRQMAELAAQYLDSYRSEDRGTVEIFNHQSGRRLAKIGVLSGFKVD